MHTVRVIVAICLVAFATSQAAAQLPTQGDLFQYRAVNRELTEVLRAFAADQRLNIVIDEEIEARLINEQIEMPPEKFLTYLTGKYGLVWYYDGTSIYINRSGDLKTQSFRLRHTTPERVAETMQVLNAYSQQFPFRILSDEKVILLVAPPRMIEMTRFVVETLEAGGQATLMNEVSVAVFPLSYASATDQSLKFQGQAVFVPGVATILQSLISGQKITGDLSTYLPRNLPGLTGYGLNRFSQTPEGKLFSRQDALVDDPQALPPGTPSRNDLATEVNPDDFRDEPDQRILNTATIQPAIRADARINAVVIRDLPARMASYEKLIHALDQPTGLIEITAKIIDVTKQGVFEWGLPYDFQWNQGGQARQFTMALTATDTANLAVTLLKDETVQFMQQIKALEQDGYAKVASRPSILTMDNMQAEINNSETFFVRVEGDFEVELFDVSVGTTLNITPRIIHQDGKRFVKLNVQLDDGAVLEQTVDEIPRIRNDSITTQALLAEDQSLLIGGLFREEKSSVESRVPVLGNLPGLGVLFRTEEYNTKRVERLILIEPRIVSLATAQAIDALQNNGAFPRPVILDQDAARAPLDATPVCPPVDATPVCPPVILQPTRIAPPTPEYAPAPLLGDPDEQSNRHSPLPFPPQTPHSQDSFASPRFDYGTANKKSQQLPNDQPHDQKQLGVQRVSDLSSTVQMEGTVPASNRIVLEQPVTTHRSTVQKPNSLANPANSSSLQQRQIVPVTHSEPAPPDTSTNRDHSNHTSFLRLFKKDDGSKQPEPSRSNRSTIFRR